MTRRSGDWRLSEVDLKQLTIDAKSHIIVVPSDDAHGILTHCRQPTDGRLVGYQMVFLYSNAIAGNGRAALEGACSKEQLFVADTRNMQQATPATDSCSKLQE